MLEHIPNNSIYSTDISLLLPEEFIKPEDSFNELEYYKEQYEILFMNFIHENKEFIESEEEELKDILNNCL